LPKANKNIAGKEGRKNGNGSLEEAFFVAKNIFACGKMG